VLELPVEKRKGAEWEGVNAIMNNTIRGTNIDTFILILVARLLLLLLY
jgi:hypothetical protein